jgi:uncharacterized protein (TIGR02145 family)
MKKKVTFLALLLSTFSFSYAQVGIGNASPNASAALDLTSSTQGFLPPRMTTEQRTSITSPAQGLTIFNTSLKCLEVYNGLHWNCEIPKNPTDVYNPTTGKIWMDRNLGASQVATSSTDFNAYGSLFQWGRAADGHQLITWTSATVGTADNGTTSGPYDGDTAPNALFIVIPGSIGPLDWRTNQNNSLWQGVNGTNNPCPWGYRLPTAAEWSAELASWTSATASGAFNSKLKLTLAGVRTRDFGSVNDEGVNFNYWSSTVDGTGSKLLNITPTSNAAVLFSVRAKGSSVRCIKD